jgi:outer membrane murein-binding lipoprotein Lpp
MLLIGALASSFLARAGTGSCTKQVVLSSNMNTTAAVFDEMAMEFTSYRS